MQAHRRPRARRRLDVQATAQAPRALLHRRQAEAARPQRGVGRVEARTVVGYLENAVVEAHGDVVRARVAQRVLERLLRDAQDLAVEPGRWPVLEVELDVDSVQSAQQLDVLA